MTHRDQWLAWAVAVLLFVPVAGAQTGADPAAQEPEEQPAEEMKVEEVIVVTASRTEQKLHDVPSAVTVLSAEEIEAIPADDYGDVLRNVPGLNVSQMSARDIQITGRGATNSLATSQLVLLDNRTLYLDFFGFVMWDFLPVNPNEIKQIEVVRGPGSAVWGANAMSGVVNLITKRPKEMVGTSLLVGGGELGTLYGSLTHAGSADKLGYKLSAGYYEQDPYPRPTGTIPGKTTPYPPFANEGTKQPKVDLRLDYDPSAESSWTFGTGYAGTDGLVHSGIGPFDIASGARMTYGKVDYARRALHVTAFANMLDADSTNLLTVSAATGRPLGFSFKTDTYNVDVGNTSVAGRHHIFTYGGNARRNEFDLEIANPRVTERDELGVYLQDEILIGDKARWLIGARWDDLDVIDPVVSPRTSLLVSPSPNHTFRLSYNRAFRAPSAINNFLAATIVGAGICVINPAITNPALCQTPLGSAFLIVPVAAIGNPGAPGAKQALGVTLPDLTEERVDAYELGYVGTFGSTIFTASVYRNETQDSIDFHLNRLYSTARPPATWPPPGIVPPGVPPQFVPCPPQLCNALPAVFTYRNAGEITDRGVELSLNLRPSAEWSWFFNYSWQDEPDHQGIPPDPGTTEVAINIPPEHRANVGGGWDGGRFYANGNLNYQDEAFWTDVLDSRFHGPTDSFTQVNLALGMRFADQKVTVAIIGSNIFDEDVQQHVFGDLITRKVSGQILFRW
jgi:outer membrane receptor protein involved in Fe transport